ncbi:ABC transporter ATP-binding protein [Actinomadura rifamycini]|uniref:ABC transporter ATP-binding protein n=1 Tax=Actinomadura rifamycini TaxID=31962 RepID=UPI0004259614|nr:ABC transporter ATP-binding protein [Actinomadura rifamycini]
MTITETTSTQDAEDPPPAPPPAPDTDTSRLVRAGALGRLLRPVRPHLIGCTVLSAVGTAAGLAPYIAIAEIARAALAGAPDVAIRTWVAVGAAGAVLRLVLLFASSRLGHYADAAILHHLRVRIVRHLGLLPLGWFRAAGSGRVKKAMTDDLEEMHQLIAHSLRELVGAVTAMAVGLAYLVLVDWRMALVTAAVPAAMLVAYRVSMRSMSAHLARLAAATGRINTTVVEYADGITVVKTFGGGDTGLGRFGEAVAEHTEAMRVWVAETRISSALSRLLACEPAVLAVVLAAGVPLVASGGLPAADLLPFLIVGIGLPTPIVPAVQGGQGLRQGRMAATGIDALLSREPLPRPTAPRPPDGHRVEFDRVSFSYDGVTDAITDVTFVCEPGTVTALVGPSGAGKSTIASLLPRFYDVTGGAIRIGGADLREIPAEALLSSMSLVFQDVALLRDTVTENIRVGRPDAGLRDVRRAAEAAQIHDVVERLPDGYGTVLGTDGAGLSGGERQRLTIARAILSDAPIVVLDEATASLDPDSQDAVQEALSTLAAGKTVLVIAHRLNTVRGADQIVVLDGGRVAETGAHDDLIARDGLYARMWRAQRNGADT